MTCRMCRTSFSSCPNCSCTTHPEARRLKSACRHANDDAEWHLGKAWRQLGAPPPMALTDPALADAIVKLRPNADPVPYFTCGYPSAWQSGHKGLSKSLCCLKPGTARDAGGWCSEALQELFAHPILRGFGSRWLQTLGIEVVTAPGCARHLHLH